MISLSQSPVNVIGGQEVTLGTGDLKIGGKTVATWTDNISKTCKSVLELDGKAITSGTKLSDLGKLKLTVYDEAGNSANVVIDLTREDSQAPKVSMAITEQNVIAGVKISIKDNQLLFNDQVVASWTDDFSESFTVELALTPEGGESKTIKSGETVSSAAKLVVTVADEFQNKSSGEITLTRIDSQAPEIEFKISEKNVISGVTVSIKDNQLLFNDQVAASWTDDYSESFTVELGITPEGGESRSIKSGDTVSDAGKLVVTVADEFQNKASGEINLTAIVVYGLETLADLQLQVDEEVDLMSGLTIAEGLTLRKVEVEQDGIRAEIADSKAYTPAFPGAIGVILTFSRPDGTTIEIGIDNLIVNPLAYDKLTVTDLKPVDILPVIGQVESGDKQVYDHIEHLRLAEATRIRDMMWEYGAGNNSPTQYREYMSRLHTGMLGEYPI